jgi:two-component system response regulator QseB
MRLLLVEDDELLGDGLKAGLSLSGYTVEWLKDGRSADIALQSSQFDLVVLDINLPDHSGLEVLKKLRQENNNVPVLLLTARDTVEDRVKGLDSGADDYLVKPFDLDELNARLRAIQRRHSGHSTPLLVHGNLILDPASHTVKLDNEQLSVSAHEFTLLHYLLNNAGRVVTRSRLEEILYGWDNSTESNSLEVFIHNLRKKIGKDYIRTVRGVGYMIENKQV